MKTKGSREVKKSRKKELFCPSRGRRRRDLPGGREGSGCEGSRRRGKTCQEKHYLVSMFPVVSCITYSEKYTWKVLSSLLWSGRCLVAQVEGVCCGVALSTPPPPSRSPHVYMQLGSSEPGREIAAASIAVSDNHLVNGGCSTSSASR